MNREKPFNGFYNYTVFLTYLGMLTGFGAIAALLSGYARLSVILLLVAGVLDMFDGLVASTRKRSDAERAFGIQIDSLSDLICFGALPALFVYVVGGHTAVSLIIGALYLLCALIRLAYFNVCEEERQQEEAGRRKYYWGLPVTSAALIFPLCLLVCKVFSLPFEIVLPAVAALMAFAFLFAFRLKKPKLVGSVALGLVGAAEFALILIFVGAA